MRQGNAKHREDKQKDKINFEKSVFFSHMASDIIPQLNIYFIENYFYSVLQRPFYRTDVKRNPVIHSVKSFLQDSNLKKKRKEI